MIKYEDFAKLDIRIGTILSAERVDDTEKLIKLSVDIGESSPRQLVAGIAVFIPEIQTLVGKQIPILVNLEPRQLRGVESQGMILAASGENGEFALLTPDSPLPNGAIVK